MFKNPSPLHSSSIKRFFYWFQLIAVFAVCSADLLAQQTVTLTAAPKIFVGAGYENVYANRLDIKTTFSNPTNQPVRFSFSPAIAGITPSFSTNDIIATDTNYLSLAVTNALPGVYTFTITASNIVTAAVTTHTGTLIVGKAWVLQGTSGESTNINWANPDNWTTTNVPVNGDDVTFQTVNGPVGGGIASFTNTLDTSLTLKSLSILYDGDVIDPGAGINLSTGVTLSVTGTNGFTFHSMSTGASAAKPIFSIRGLDSTFIVSNQISDFSVGTCGGGSGGSTMNLTNLGSFIAVVNRFGLGDSGIPKAGNTLATINSRVFNFARTNFVTTSFVGDYNGLNPVTTAVGLANNMDLQGQVQPGFFFGISNVFYTDSVGLGLCRAGSSSPGPIAQFNRSFTNRSSFNPILILRGMYRTNRVSFIGVGVDSGTSASQTKTQGTLDLSAGKSDILVDTIWLGHDRTNATGESKGTLNIGEGIVDVNTLRLGFKQFTNNSGTVSGVLTVGTNGNLVINNELAMGGTVTITGGSVRAKTIKLGQPSFANKITMRGGASLVVSNTIASTSSALDTLDMDNSTLTLNINGIQNPLVYVTNLTCGSTQSKINIGSIANVASLPVTLPLIKYELATYPAAPIFTVGTLPAGITSATINDNTTTSVIEITLNGTIQNVNTNPPQMLVTNSVVNNAVITTIAWPQDRTGWRLQTQSNSLAVGIAGNWVDVPGSTSVRSVTVTNSIINPHTRFYRLVYP